MAKVAGIETNFNAGELSPLMLGRVDFDKYKNALKTCINHIPVVQGAIGRRPGTYFVSEVKDSSKATRIIRFEFSTTQAYIIEIGNLYMRFYRAHGRVESPPGTAVEIVTPYLTADIFNLMFVQSADVLYVVHPSYAPRKVSRTSDTAWTITTIAFQDGPYLDSNVTATTLTFSATTGTGVTCTASAITGINGGTGFQATDVGRVIRAQTSAAAWGWATITARASTTVVTVTISSAMGATTATSTWRLGLWSDTTGYPCCTTFYEDRLCFGGSTAAPERIDGSATGAYETFSPTALDTAGTVAAADGIAFTLNSEDVQVIRWMAGDSQGLLVGTIASEWIVSPSTLNEALTPTNVKAKPMSSYGSALMKPIRAGYSSLFLQKAGRKLRELAFVYVENRYHAPDMTVLSEHITLGGIKEMAFQQEPHGIIWAVRNDGVLLGFTYQRDQNVVGWHRHILGGGGLAESVATIPAPDATRDETWVVVNRTIGGATKRYIEYMTKPWEHGDLAKDAIHLDCALTYSGVPVTSVTGATHLIGETVSVWADGATHPDVVVDGSGHIALVRSASTVQVGYSYNSDGQRVRDDSGAADGTAQGKTQRTHRVIFRVLDTLGLKYGRDFDNMTEVISRRASDDLGAAVPLFTGDISQPYEGIYSTEDTICWRFDTPAPGTILLISPQKMTMDR
jgi:hypothetical protein